MQTQELKEQVNNSGVCNLICSHLAGSHAYGTSTPSSDVDVRGIFCAERGNITTPFRPYREQTIESMEDAKVYEVSNYLELYIKGNPNILESLWVEDCDVLTSSEAYEYLKQYRQQLLSKKVAFTYPGYALSQLKRIKGHNKWINNPCPVEPPKQTKYVTMVQNFTDKKILPSEFTLENYRKDCRLIPFGGNLYGLYIERSFTKGYNSFNEKYQLNTVFKDESRVGFGAPDLIVKWNKEEYNLAKDNHTNYWKWKNNRNVVRSELEEKYGYDSKHAMHLVRLLRSGEEILSEGIVRVKRHDAEELLSIRNGAWTYEELIEYAEEKDNYVRTTLYNSSDLPKKPDLKLAEKVLIDIQDMFWK